MITAVRGFKMLAAMSAVAVMSACAFAQETAYVPFVVNVDATVKAKQGTDSVSMSVTADNESILEIPLGGVSVRYTGGAKGMNAPTVTGSRGNITLRLPAQSYNNAEIALYAVNGKRIMRDKAAASETAAAISRRNVAAGVYMLSVKGINGDAFTTRLTHNGGNLNINAAFGAGSVSPDRPLANLFISPLGKSAAAGNWDITVSADGCIDSSYTLNVAAGTNPAQNITLIAGSSDGIPVPGADLTAKFQWLNENAESGTEYLVSVGDDTNIAPQTLSYTGKTGITITVKGAEAAHAAAGKARAAAGTERTISLTQNGTLFTVNAGVTLVLENVTLSGNGTNTVALVEVNNDGKLVMKDGAKITNNQNRGVYIDGGEFVMDGGEITDNSCGASYGGGGVFNWGGSFTMNGGLIARNKFSNTVGGGGGVFVQGGSASFTFNGGKISDNTVENNIGTGGGVGNEGIFTMTGGEISGNNIIAWDNPAGEGGGVFSSGTFTMSGGVIKGNSARYGGGVTNRGTFEKTASGGVIYGSNGGADANIASNSETSGSAIYVYSYGGYVHRETTVSASERLYVSHNPQTHEGAWEVYE